MARHKKNPAFEGGAFRIPDLRVKKIIPDWLRVLLLLKGTAMLGECQSDYDFGLNSNGRFNRFPVRYLLLPVFHSHGV